MNGVSDDAIKLRLFPFSLRERAKSWLHDNESLYEAWERFKDLLRKYPNHGIEKWLQVHNFYNGLVNNTRTLIDVAVGGAFMRKSANEAFELLEEMAITNQQWSTERGHSKKVIGMHEVDAITKLTTQVEALTKLVTAQAKQAQVICELCGGPLTIEICPIDVDSLPMEQVQAIGNYQNNCGFNQGGCLQNFQNKFPNQQQQGFYPQKNQSQQSQQYQQQQDSNGKGNLPSTTEVNLKENCKAITLRSGKNYAGPSQDKLEEEEDDELAPTPKKKKTTDGLQQKETSPPISIDHHIKIPYPQRLLTWISNLANFLKYLKSCISTFSLQKSWNKCQATSNS
ncbi:uncharacterized protein LOC133034212 [Cannabis sativa]|uniref:uncharacterized protein LOC133034212 n=1 Tax=Cannabis sativa TaxID=3483 RepID=UPI0029CA05AF|nr:uncharacterized protein LOC133034212 [Cannabis sativa]